MSSSTYSGYQLGKRERRRLDEERRRQEEARKKELERQQQMEIIAEKERLAVFRRLSELSSTIFRQEDPVRTRTAGGKKEREAAPEKA